VTSGSKRTLPEFSMLRNFRTTAVFRITFRSASSPAKM
jgi:hypothetical protein